MATFHFHRAARRHFKDAEVLHQHGSPAGAGHLHGLAAECGIKALLAWQGDPTDPQTGDLLRSARIPAPKPPDLRTQGNDLGAFLQGRAGSRYLALLPKLEHFTDWRVEYRDFDTVVIRELVCRRPGGHGHGPVVEAARRAMAGAPLELPAPFPPPGRTGLRTVAGGPGTRAFARCPGNRPGLPSAAPGGRCRRAAEGPRRPGLVQRLRDGRVQIPDVDPVTFGLGRRGGVRPLQ